MFGKKKDSPVKSYDSARYEPVLKCSICNGEMVAGFREKESGKFEEVSLIRSDKELQDFMAVYGIDHIGKEY